MSSSPDRTLKHFRLDPAKLADIVDIMSRNGRGVVVKIDDQKLADPKAPTASQLSGAKEVDIQSFWINPEREHWGRRHFVYFLANPTEAQYFGDSVSPEVTEVVEALDRYFNTKTSAKSILPTKSAGTATLPQWPLLPLLIIAGLAIAVIAFLLGRWSAY